MTSQAINTTSQAIKLIAEKPRKGKVGLILVTFACLLFKNMSFYKRLYLLPAEARVDRHVEYSTA